MNLKEKVSKILLFLSDEDLETETYRLDFQLAPNSEFIRGRAYEAKRVRRKIHAILGEEMKSAET